MGFVERFVVAALLALAVVSGAQTADPAESGTAGPRVEESAGAR